MKKRLLGLMAAIFAIASSWAQDGMTDVTSTYLTDNYAGQAKEVYAGWGAVDTPSGQFTQEVTLPAGDYRLTGYAFYRYGVSSSTDPTISTGYMFAGEKEVTVVTLGSIEGLGSYADNPGQAQTAFYTNNYYLNTLDFSLTEETTMTIGYRCTHALKQSWFIVGQLTLYQLALDAFIADYETAYSKVNNLEAATLNTAMNNKIQTVLSETENVAQTKDDLQAATAKLNTVYAEAVAMQAAMSKVLDAMNGCYDLMDAVNSTGDVETLEAAIQKAEADLDVAEDATVADAIVADLNAAKMAYIPTIELGEGETLDMSWLIVNPTFDTNISGWTSEGGAQNKAHASNKSNGIITGGFFENWNPSPFTGTIYQVINGLPNGKYKVKAAAFGNGAHVFANDAQVQMTSDEGTWYEVETMVSNGTLKFGIVNNNNTGWMGIDNVSIAFAGAVDLSELQATLAEKLVEAEAIDQATAMNAEALAALTTAITNAKNVAETEEALTTALADLTTAITAVNTSITDYANLKKALDKAAEILASTNVYVEADKVAYETAYNDAKAAYEAGTYVADANTINKLWNTGYKDGNLLARPFISSVWSEDDAVYTNNWSVEADNKANGSGMTVPFVEYWTADGNSLGAKTIDTTVEGLAAGTYKVTALVRVRLKNGASSSDNVTFSANDASVEVCDGKTCDDGAQFRYDNYRLIATVAEDGKLTIALNVADGNNVSWLSFKNVNYATVTDEELAEIEKEIEAAKVAAAKEVLYTVGAKMATLNATINDAACTALLEEAQALYDDAEATLGDVEYKASELHNALNLYISKNLLNGSFESELENWTAVSEGQYAYSGVAAYGSETAVNSTLAPATDIAGGMGSALGIFAAWGNKMSYTQDVTLPAGKYILSYEAYNSNPTANVATNLTGVTVGETSFNSALTSYEGSKWTTEAIAFELTEESTVTVTVGYTSNNIGSGSTAKLWYDNVNIYMTELPATVYDFTPASTTPADGGTAVGMSMFSMMFNDYVNINMENSSTIIVYNAETDELAYTGTLTPNWMSRGMGLNVVFDAPLAAGSYYITFAQGLFGNNAWVESGYTSGNANPELTYNFTAEDLVVEKDPTTCTPYDGEYVQSISQFEIAFAHKFDLSYATSEMPILRNADGETVVTFAYKNINMNSDWTTMIFALEEPITEPGTYEFVLPEGFISLMDDSYNQIGTNNAFTTTAVIGGPTVYDFTPETTTPADGGTAVGMSMFSMMFNDYVNINMENSSTIIVYNAETDELAYTGTLTPNWMSRGMGLNVVFDAPLAAGSYYITFAQGLFGNNAWVESGYTSGNANPELTYNFTAEDLVVEKDPTTCTPYDGEYVQSISQFEIAFAHKFDLSYATSEMPILRNADGETVVTFAYKNINMNSDWTTMIFALEEPITEPGTYEFVLPEGFISLMDDSYNQIGTNNAFTTTAVISGPTVYDFVPASTNPADGETAVGMSSFVLSFDEYVNINYEMNSNVKVYNAETDEAAYTGILTTDMMSWGKGLKVQFPEALAPGSYYITFAEGLFGNNAWIESGFTSGNANPELTYNFTAEELVVVKEPTTLTPADGSTVETITQFEIAFAHQFDRSYATTENPVVVDADGNVVEEIKGGQVEWNDDWTVMILKLNTPIATKGTYTLKIPAEYISLMDDAYNVLGYTDEITATVICEGGDGINSIYAEDGNVTVYTLNGVKLIDNKPASELKNLKKGMYIVNGKTMVIK